MIRAKFRCYSVTDFGDSEQVVLTAEARGKFKGGGYYFLDFTPTDADGK